jgi:hypothetical protein
MYRLLQIELDGYIAADCPLCGFLMIKSIAMPLTLNSNVSSSGNNNNDEDAEEVKNWEL